MSPDLLREAAKLMRERAKAKTPEQRNVGPYIVSWHPDVAFAVADLLEALARVLPIGDDGKPLILAGSTYEHAVTVARTYLGRDA